MRKIVAGKLHGIHVTDANLNYHGSITLDPDHCEEAGILPMEFVEIWNKNSGARISTYVILGERGSRCCILNADNNISGRLSYSVSVDEVGRYKFDILDDGGEPQPIPLLASGN